LPLLLQLVQTELAGVQQGPVSGMDGQAATLSTRTQPTRRDKPDRGPDVRVRCGNARRKLVRLVVVAVLWQRCWASCPRGSPGREGKNKDARQ